MDEDKSLGCETITESTESSQDNGVGVHPRVMRNIFTISDIHIDYKDNKKWVEQLGDSCDPYVHYANYIDDVLVLSGDISDNTQRCFETLKFLSTVFGLVFFTPGNHDLWINKCDSKNYNEVDTNERNAEAPDDDYQTRHPTRILPDSLDKLHYILSMCEFIGVETKPKVVLFRNESAFDYCKKNQDRSGDNSIIKIMIVPILSWHHVSWDLEPDVLPRDQKIEFQNFELPPLEQTVLDYSRTKWPDSIYNTYKHKCRGMDCPVKSEVNCCCNDMKLLGHHGLKDTKIIQQSESIAYAIDKMNDQRCTDAFNWDHRPTTINYIISCSHFAPYNHLVPEKRNLFFPSLMKASGSTFLRRRLERLKPDVHLFGHLHFGWDMTIYNTRYIQATLAYPKERLLRHSSLQIGACPNKPLLLFSNGQFEQTFTAKMSDTYTSCPRTPENTIIAPWIEDVWRKLL